MNQPTRPSVLFVWVKNSGKSQMAAGLDYERMALIRNDIRARFAGLAKRLLDPATDVSSLS